MATRRRWRSGLHWWNGVVVLIWALMARAAHGQGFAERRPAPDHGTDPSRLRKLTQVSYGVLDPGPGSARSTLQLIGGAPVLRHTSLEATLPFVSADVTGRTGLGDVTLKVDEILGRTRRSGHTLRGELTLATAERPELGAGVGTFQASYIYARFLRGGALFAPSIAQCSSIGEDANGNFINRMVVDLHYVPRFGDPRHFMTVDPALTFDWEHGRQYTDLGFTFGRVIGTWLGGSAQLYSTPSVSAGGDQPAGWGIEAGSQLIGS